MSRRVSSVSASPTLPRLFLGSSAEGREVARNLQAELGNSCEVVLWYQNVFEPSGYALDSLISAAASVDFAVLVATPDDKTDSRGETTASARDNVVLEFGLFAGALGRKRTYLLATGDLKLPTDALGLTRLPYRPRSDGNHRAAVTEAALLIEERVRSMGRLDRASAPVDTTSPLTALQRELDLLCDNAVAQGWTVKTNSQTTLRLVSPRGRPFTLTKSQPNETRFNIRYFASQLRAAGLRVNYTLRRPVDESPF